jgi:hypothetical protein
VSEFCSIILIEEVARRIFTGSATLSSNRYLYSAPIYFTCNIVSTNSILAAYTKILRGQPWAKILCFMKAALPNL